MKTPSHVIFIVVTILDASNSEIAFVCHALHNRVLTNRVPKIALTRNCFLSSLSLFLSFCRYFSFPRLQRFALYFVSCSFSPISSKLPDLEIVHASFTVLLSI